MSLLAAKRPDPVHHRPDGGLHGPDDYRENNDGLHYNGFHPDQPDLPADSRLPAEYTCDGAASTWP